MLISSDIKPIIGDQEAQLLQEAEAIDLEEAKGLGSTVNNTAENTHRFFESRQASVEENEDNWIPYTPLVNSIELPSPGAELHK